MRDRFQGDPKLFLTANGSRLDFKGGQPVMDQGFENQAFISLFTAPGWWGNDLTTDASEKIGSDFQDTAKGAVTLQKLRDIEQAAEDALRYDAFGNIEAVATNTVSSKVDVAVTISPPGQDVQELRLTKNGQNWYNQAIDPAHLKGDV